MDPMTMMAISSGVGALGGALGGNEEHIGPGDYVPDWLKQDWKNIGGGIADLQTPEYYQGQLVAGQNPWMQQALGGMAGYGQEGGMGYDAANAMMQGGQMGLGAMGQGMDYLGQMQNRGPNQFQYDQGTYDQSFNNLTGGLQNQFDLGALQMQQNFDWNQLPGLNMANALGGGQGSTKFGQSGALGQAMTNQNIANFGSGLWQNAANQANTGAMNAGSQNLASANALDQNLMNQYGQYAQLGSNMMGQGYDMGTNNLGLGLQAGQIQQGYDQSLIDAQMAKHNFEQQAPWLATENKLNMINGQKMGSAPQTTGMNPWQGAMQGALGGLGLYGAGQKAGWWGQDDASGGGGDPFRTS